MRRRGAWGAALAILAAGSLGGQTPRPATKPRPAATPRAKPARSPLDFTGVWELDPTVSRGVSRRMEGAVLSVQQNGNRIWIEPIERSKGRLLAEQIIVDGRPYEKSIGGRKGTVSAQWGKDEASLWLEAVAGTEQGPRAATQRMVWRLRDGGQTWIRQTRTVQEDGVKQTLLIFRRRSASRPPTPPPKATPLR